MKFSFLLNPFLLALWATIPFIFLLPYKENHYQLNMLEQGTYNSDIRYRYEDLDGDGNSEAIAVFTNSLGQAGMTISNSSGFLSQWNFTGKISFSQIGFLITADCNRDQTSEVNLFTISGDSVMLNFLPDYRNTRKMVTRFVCRVNSRNGKIDPYITGGDHEDLNGDGTDELIFAIGTGFSLQPRNVFAYDIAHDNFLVSPKSGYFIGDIMLADILGDLIREIIPYGYAAENSGNSLPYPDSVSWLMVLDKNLHFAFNPVSFSYAFSALHPFVIPTGNGKNRLAALYIPFDKVEDSAKIFLFDTTGRITKTIPLDGIPNQAMCYRDIRNRTVILVNTRNAGLKLYDGNFRLKKSKKFTGNCLVELMDADNDGNEEILSTDIFSRTVTVLRNDLKYPVTRNFEGDGEHRILFSSILKKDEPPKLYMQFGKSFTIFQYGYNATWWFGYAKYILIYGIMVLFMLLSRKLQRDQIRKKQQTERKIIDLQIRQVSQQLDPHFIMNSINGIMASNTLDDKEKVRSQLMHFARLHRSLLMQSDKIMISLQEETDFVCDFMAMEKYRYPDRFEYRLHIDPEVNMDIPVPKMLLQIHAENALKHGILPLEDKYGLLEISFTMDQVLYIEIKDNGVGRQASEGKSISTGKGTLLMEQYYELLEKLDVARLKHEVSDLYDESGLPAGTRVLITVFLEGTRDEGRGTRSDE